MTNTPQVDTRFPLISDAESRLMLDLGGLGEPWFVRAARLTTVPSSRKRLAYIASLKNC